MQRLAWLTDIHLEWLRAEAEEPFYAGLAASDADAFLIGGDIGTATTVVTFLLRLQSRLQRPICFALGNHDFYGGGVQQVRQTVKDMAARSGFLHYLTFQEVVPLTESVGLVGHDGWADGRFGDYAHSTFEMSDFHLIQDLINPFTRLRKLNALGDEAAAHFRTVLPAACEQYRKIILLTHVPPFREAAWHQGHTSDDNALPFFASRAAGEAMVEVMRQWPDRALLVLCGHTHSPGEIQVLPNVKVITGGARYGQPEIQRVIAVD